MKWKEAEARLKPLGITRHTYREMYWRLCEDSLTNPLEDTHELLFFVFNRLREAGHLYAEPPRHHG